MREIIPGVFHWTTFHQPIRARVSSYYVQAAGIVIDPKVPEDGLEALPSEPQQVVLTSGHHDRDSQRFADTFGVPIRASREADEYLGGELEIETFADGDELAPGVTAIHMGKIADDESALHIDANGGAIAIADALNHWGGELAFMRDSLLGDDPEGVKRGLLQSFGGLLTRDFDHLLFAHGEPLVGGAKSALRRFVKSQAPGA